MRIELELYRDVSGRPDGSVRGPGEAERVRFIGTIQLLRVLEELTDDDGRARRPTDAERTG